MFVIVTSFSCLLSQPVQLEPYYNINCDKMPCLATRSREFSPTLYCQRI